MPNVHLVRHPSLSKYHIPEIEPSSFISICQYEAKPNDYAVVCQPETLDGRDRLRPWAVVRVRDKKFGALAGKPVARYLTPEKAVKKAIALAERDSKRPETPAPRAGVAVLEVTLAEIEILRRALAPEIAYWEYAAEQPPRDEKERDRVQTYRHQTKVLAEKIGRANQEASPAV
jgi:hypothetical protein